MLETVFLVLVLAAALAGAVWYQLRAHVRRPGGDGLTGGTGCGSVCASCPIGGEGVTRSRSGGESTGQPEEGGPDGDDAVPCDAERE